MIKVTEIEFDFETDDGWMPSERNKKELVNRVLSKTFDCSEDELCDLITDATGWCITHIDYVVLAECS